jgi:hypothetical protein
MNDGVGKGRGDVFDLKAFSWNTPVGQINTLPVMAYYLKAFIYDFNEQKLKHG